jgi:hypothetical protein
MPQTDRTLLSILLLLSVVAVLQVRQVPLTTVDQVEAVMLVMVQVVGVAPKEILAVVQVTEMTVVLAQPVEVITWAGPEAALLRQVQPEMLLLVKAAQAVRVDCLLVLRLMAQHQAMLPQLVVMEVTLVAVGVEAP